MLPSTGSISADDAASQVLERIAEGDPNAPLTLQDHLTNVGLYNPYTRALALRLLRARLQARWQPCASDGG